MFGTLEHHPGAGGLGFKMLLHTFFFFKMEKHKDCMGTWGRQAGWLPADPPPNSMTRAGLRSSSGRIPAEESKPCPLPRQTPALLSHGAPGPPSGLAG